MIDKVCSRVCIPLLWFPRLCDLVLYSRRGFLRVVPVPRLLGGHEECQTPSVACGLCCAYFSPADVGTRDPFFVAVGTCIIGLKAVKFGSGRRGREGLGLEKI